jgi:hypothetical protein
MKVRVALIAAWLIVGQAVIGALYWIFLTTPESNTAMLLLSAALVLVMVLVAGVTLGSAILISASRSISRAVWGAPWIIVSVLPAIVLWWLVTVADRWIAAHSGEIAAWFIATLGWADVSWLMRGLDYLSLWLRAVVAPLLSLSLFAALLFRGRATLGELRWVGRAVRPTTLVVSTLAFVLFIALPLQAAYWQPQGLPPTWVEPAAAGVRLFFITLLATIGWSIMIAMVADRRAAEPPPTVVPISPSEPSDAGKVTLD